MDRNNLKFISQPGWKVLIVDSVARMLGLLVLVEGMPIGSSRNYIRAIRSKTDSYRPLVDWRP